jgi:peptidoglycan hydrolase-like protein with peptidoglycan-binding domain
MAVLVAVGIPVLVVAASGSGGGVTSGPSSSSGATGTVARRTLAKRLTATGAIGYAGEATVLARLSGTVTALPAIGEVINRGEPLYALGDEPVLLLYGSVPAYRTLAGGVSDGEDIEQLEGNLLALGYEPGPVDEEFSYQTTEAVDAWQEDLDLEVTGEVDLGRVTFLRGPQRVTKLEATLGEALVNGNGGSGASGEMVAWRPEAGNLAEAEEPAKETQQAAEQHEREEVQKREEREREKAKAEREIAKKGHESPPGQGGEETSPGPREGLRNDENGTEDAESEPASIPILRTSSTRRVVSVELEADQQSIAHRGQKVQIVLPGGAEVSGKVSGLAAVESSGKGNSGEEVEPGVEATISIAGKHRIPALDGATVSVRFTQRVRKHVLSVPLTALIAIGGERFAVYVRGDRAQRRIVVTPGLAADGYVEVKGKGLQAGMTVETGE